MRKDTKQAISGACTLALAAYGAVTLVTNISKEVITAGHKIGDMIKNHQKKADEFEDDECDDSCEGCEFKQECGGCEENARNYTELNPSDDKTGKEGDFREVTDDQEPDKEQQD